MHIGQTIRARHLSSYFLHEGRVEVSKNGVAVALVSEPGAVFGEMSILLEMPPTATVCCADESRFYVVERPQALLLDNPAVTWHVAQILAVRVFNLTQYLVNVKEQYAGHDHLGMVHGLLETLSHQQQTAIRQRPDSERGKLDGVEDAAAQIDIQGSDQ